MLPKSTSAAVLISLWLILFRRDCLGGDGYAIRHGDHDTDRTVYQISRDGVHVASFDLREYVDEAKGEDFQNYYPEHLPPLSPDQKLYPFILEGNFRGDGNDGYLLLVDARNGAAVRKTVFRDQHLGSLCGVEWVNNEKLAITYGGVPRQLIFDINTEKYRIVDGLYSLAMDKRGDNYCCLWEEIQPRHGQPVPIPEQRSQYVRYNGYWVYPKPLKGFVSPEDFWAYERGQNKENYPALKDPNYGSDRHFAFSKPVFLGDTLWVAFVEQVYESKRPDRLLETNLIVLDAHEVGENPPDPAKVHVCKRPIAALPVGVAVKADEKQSPDESPYAHLSALVTVDWTSATQTLDIGKPRYEDATGKTTHDPFAKIGVDLAKMEIGEYKTVETRSEAASPGVRRAE